jgi:hypothetical protein
MDESKKKLVMIIVIVVCLGVAGAVFFGGRGSGGGTIDDISDEEMTWMKCRNPSCNAEFETGLKEYFKFVTANANPMAPSAPLMPCETCGEPSAAKAEKCQNAACGKVFRSGAVPNDFPDRCPTCKQSATEEIRKARKKEMAGG